MQSKRFTINLREVAPLLAVLIATWYFVISGIIINGGIQIICFSLFIIIIIASQRNRRLSLIDVSLLLSTIPFFYCIKEWNISAIRDVVAYFAFVIFILFVKTESNNVNKAIRFLYGMAFFHLLFVIINILFRDSYTNFLYSILDSGALPTYNKAIAGNYYTGFGYIPGDTSGYLVDGIIILLFGSCLINNNRRFLKIILLSLGILFCAKKSHLICLALTVLITWIVTGKGSKKAKRVIGSILLVVSVLTIGYLILPFFSGIPMLNRITIALDSYLSGNDFTSNRTNLTNYAIQMYNENRMFGAGWKAFNRFTFSRWGGTNYVNNVYLQLAAETGIIGAILFISPMIISLVKTFRKLSDIQKNNINFNNAYEYIQLSFALQVFFLLYCFFEIPFYDYTFLFVYALAVAMTNCTDFISTEAEQ